MNPPHLLRLLLLPLVLLLLPTVSLSANPNTGGATLSPSSFTGTLSALNDLQLTVLGSTNPLDRSFGAVLIFDANGNHWVNCTQYITPTVYPNGSTTIRIGDMFGELTYMPAGNYTLIAGGYLTGFSGCSASFSLTLAQARTGYWSDNTMDIPLTITETPPVISFFNPSPNTLNRKFNYWSIDGYGFPASSTAYDLKIYYHPQNNTSTIFLDEGTVTSYGSNPFLQVPKTRDLSGSGEWNAWAELWDTNNNFLSSSSLIYFQYSSSSALIGPTMPSSTPIIDCAGDTWCNILSAVFVPKWADLQQFDTLRTDYANKPPFGYFTAIKTELDRLSVGTSSVQLINASTSEAIVPLGLLRSGVAWLLWFLFGFWVFHKIRNFEI